MTPSKPRQRHLHTANANSDVGTYGLTVSGMTATNYNFIYAAGSTLTVDPATLTVTPNNETREYGENNPTFTSAFTGFKLGQDDSVVNQGGATYTTAANANSDVGAYGLTVSGMAATNYNFTYATGSTVTVSPATLTVTPNNETREYGENNPTFTSAFTGFKLGQNDSVVTQTGATYTTAANANSDVGTYGLTVSGMAATNYNFTYATGSTVTVSPATLTVTPNSTNREYGENNPTFTSAFTGFKLGQDDSVVNQGGATYTTANANSDVGTYGLTVSGMTATNYNFIYAAGSTLTVDPATLTVTPNETREYGENNPTFTSAFIGFKLGQMTCRTRRRNPY